MTINQLLKKALKVLSFPNMNVRKRYKLIRQLDTIKSKTIVNPKHYFFRDEKILVGSREIPVRIFSPENNPSDQLMLFIHGGGWVTGSIQSYTNVCFDMVRELNCTVISVDYRRAPEFHFPCALEDCYAVSHALFVEKYMPEFDPDHITVIGDSAGGNLAAALSLLARDRGEFLPKRQILLYPSTSNDHSPASPFDSIRDNGEGYLLTSPMIEGYMEMYQSSDEDKQNPYLAPLLAQNLTNQPNTLIITAEFCPLRDEGEAYGKLLQRDGCKVEIYCMQEALHGFFSLPRRFSQVKKAYGLISNFLGGDADV